MGHSAWLNAALLVVVAGCIDSASVPCGFGLCPPGSSCDETAKVCIPAGCGNGVVAGDEECDGALPAGQDCTTYGFYDADGLACSSDCKIDVQACAKTCGDHVRNGPETCDGVPPLEQSCVDYGFELGRLACSPECGPAFNLCASIGWKRGIGGAPGDLRAVWGANGNDIYAVGAGGVIMHQADQGVWTAMTSPTTEDLRGIWGASAKDIYAVGAEHTILHYDGAAWSVVVTQPGTKSLTAISGHITFDANKNPTAIQIWAVGEAGAIATTAYAPGASGTWGAETSGVTVDLAGVWAQGTDFVVAVGDATSTGTASPTAIKRALDTATWTAIPTPTITPITGTASLAAVWGSGASFVAVGSATTQSGQPRGSVLVLTPTTTGQFVYTGQSLSPFNLTSVWGVVSPQPANPSLPKTDIFIGGGGGTMLHFTGTIGSANFDRFELHTTLQIAGVWGTGPAVVRAVTLGGDLEEYDGTDLSAQVLAPLTKLDAVWHDPTTNVAVAGGANGTVIRRDFAGWATPITIGTGIWTGAYGFATAGPAHIFLCGTDGNGIIKSTDGGTSWGGASLGGFFWQSLWGTAETSVWAVGNGGHVSHYDGTTWAAPIVVPFTGATAPSLRSVWGASDSDIYVVGGYGAPIRPYLAHYNGATWTELPSGVTDQMLNGVWGASSTDVFVAGGAGIILHWDGTAWHRMTSNTGRDLGSVGGTGHGDVFIGGRGALYHYIGTAWAPMTPVITDAFGLWVDQDAAFFVGTGDVARLRRTPLVAERCGDPWDNDYDGLADCADADCYPQGASPDSGCRAGGACAPVTPITCGHSSEEGSTTFTGIARIDDLPCLDHATPGPEAAYRLVADHDGPITITLDDPDGHLDLVQLDAFDATRTACDVGHCRAAPATGDRTITFDGHPDTPYYFVVDGPEGLAEAFTLSVACP